MSKIIIIKSVSIDYTRYECSLYERYCVSVDYKSGVVRSYVVDSYEKIPCTVRNFLEINKSSVYSSDKYCNGFIFHVLLRFHEISYDESIPKYESPVHLCILCSDCRNFFYCYPRGFFLKEYDSSIFCRNFRLKFPLPELKPISDEDLEEILSDGELPF